MIELNTFLMILRRRALLLVLGLVIGLLVGFLLSRSQQPTYETSTKLLVSNQLQGKSSDFAGLTNQQLVLTYVQMLKTKDLMDKAAENAGVEFSSGQVTIQQIPDTQVIEIKVEADNAEQAALIANTMAQTLLEEIASVRSGQFSTAEATLTKQIDQAKQKIDELQKEYDQTGTQIYQDELSQAEKQIAGIQAQIATLQDEIVRLSSYPTLDNRAQIAQKEAEVSQLQSSFRLYDELHANLVVLGKASESTRVDDHPELQQIKTTIALYQKIYTDLLASLEATKLAELQQTPNALQIQEAFAPASPLSPVTSEYTLLGGAAGLMLALAIVVLLEVLRESASVTKRTLLAETKV